MKWKLFLAGTAASLALFGYLYASREPAAPDALPSASSHVELAAVVTNRASGAPGGANPKQTSAQHLQHELETATDLRQVYERYQNSASELEKSIAYRAWSACFPGFIAPQGQAFDLEKVRVGLPPDVSTLRVEAYRALYGRCKNFSSMTREQTVAATESQRYAQANGTGLTPGERAAKLFIDGAPAKALAAAQIAIDSQDPYALNSLKDYIYQYWATRVDTQPELRNERPDLRSLAFSMAACQLGLDCGADTLTAMLQCANSGDCEGGVTERYLHGMPSDADRDALRRETQRTLEAIRRRDYAALGLR